MIRGSRRDFLKTSLAGAALATIGASTEQTFAAEPVLGLIQGMNIVSFAEAPPVTQDDVLKLAVRTRESVPRADAMVISCGALRTIDILAPFEERCKLPVVSSHPHALWDAVRLAGLSGRSLGYGTLLAKG